MAKIRDLGINFIPVTMRPLEIGPGVALPGPHDPGHLHAAPMLNLCDESACAACQDNTEGGSSCDPSGCGGPQCQPHSGPPGCPPPTHRPGPPPGYHTSGFTDEAVAQLKQQLNIHLRKEWVN